jgi:hypothetical protein
MDSTLSYSRSFANDSSWTTLTLNYENINKIIIRLDSAGNGGLTDYNFDNITFDNNPLPVELTGFNAQVSQNGVELIWKTATELNNYGFEVQRSVISSQQSADSQKLNADSWIKIGFVKGNGSSTVPKDYSFIDNSVTDGNKYNYRLKQIDNNGDYKFSSVIEVTANMGPINYKLNQNYPNPFNPTTTINYSLPVKDKVNLKVYNITGREIASLVDEVKEAGSYSVKFSAHSENGADLPSGIYFYRLTTSHGSQVKKMILLK